MLGAYSFDLLWCVMCNLSGKEIVSCRTVCRAWCVMVDSVSLEQWRELYMTVVSDVLCVRSSFNWKRAALCSVNYEHGLRVFCTWKSVWMFLASPWASDSHEVCINTPLRTGVERVNVSQANDYIYDKSFRLRGIARSCNQQNTHWLCTNCRTRSKRRCLAMRYDYYVSDVSDSANREVWMLDEALAFRLVCTRQSLARHSMLQSGSM